MRDRAKSSSTNGAANRTSQATHFIMTIETFRREEARLWRAGRPRGDCSA
jgi:hypothetical protein